MPIAISAGMLALGIVYWLVRDRDDRGKEREEKK